MSGGDGRLRFRDRTADGRGLRQIANIRDQLPNLLFGQLPARHGRVADSILDQVKQFSVRPFSRFERMTAQAQRRRIQAGSRGSFSVAIVAVADLAISLVKVTPERRVREFLW
jgi:hypothetical protein